MQISVLGDFLCHADSDSKALIRRAKAIHDLYVKYDKSVEDHGPANCLDEVLSDPLVRAFLHEGAADICHQSQIKALSDDHKHFYPEGQPTTKAEFPNNVRSVQDILEDPWFTTENGRPSITALIRKIMVGDYVLVPGNDEIRAENVGWINQNAAQFDGQTITPHICAKKGWVMEMMSLEKPNVDKISSWDTPGRDLNPVVSATLYGRHSTGA
jgi:hypothetical protein